MNIKKEDLESKYFIFILKNQEKIKLKNLENKYEFENWELEEYNFIDFEKKKKQYLISRIFIKKLIYKLFSKEIVFQRNKSGKLCFKNFKKYFFSISYSDNLVLIGFAKYNLGVDIEKIKSRNIKNERYFSESEVSYIGSNSMRLFEIWTQKEAFLKLKKMSILNFKKIDISIIKKKYFINTNKFNNNIYSVCLEKNIKEKKIVIDYRDLI